MIANEMAYWQQSILRSLGVLAAVLLPAGTFVYVFLFKMVSFMQNRLGPMEAGPYGSLQLLAEVGKFLQKEDLFPRGADRRVFAWAPIVVVTSNEERQLPDAFLRRCVFHEIAFPDDATLMQIVASGLRKRLPSKNPDDPNDPSGYDLPAADGEILLGLLAEFRDMRLDKRPGISEAIDAATLLAYPRSLPSPPLAERLPLVAPALAKLRNDRYLLTGLIDGAVTRLAATG